MTYYPTKAHGFGFSYAKGVLSYDGVVTGGIALGGIDSDIYGLKADWFAKENFQLTFEYLNGEIEPVDLEGLEVEATFRFSRAIRPFRLNLPHHTEKTSSLI